MLPVYHFNESDAAFQVRPEVRERVTILRCGPEAYAVCEYGLQEFQVAPPQANLPVHHNSGKLLTDALPHDASLVVIDAEALFERNRGGVRRESFDQAMEFLAAGERQVVGVEANRTRRLDPAGLKSRRRKSG